MRSLHCMLEKGVDLFVKKCQRVGQCHVILTEIGRGRRKMDTFQFFTSCGLVCNCICIALLLHLLDRKSLVGNDGGVYNA